MNIYDVRRRMCLNDAEWCVKKATRTRSFFYVLTGIGFSRAVTCVCLGALWFSVVFFAFACMCLRKAREWWNYYMGRRSAWLCCANKWRDWTE